VFDNDSVCPEHLAIEIFNRLLSFYCIAHLDVAEAFRLPGEVIGYYLDADDCAVIGEEAFQVPFGCLVGEIADVDFSGCVMHYSSLGLPFDKFARMGRFSGGHGIFSSVSLRYRRGSGSCRSSC